MVLRFAVVALAGLFIAASPAHAKLEVCNRTSSPISVAIAFETDADIVSQGWWTVDPDQCERVINTDLNRQYYYHYVRSAALNMEWAGTYNFCTADDPQFRINGASNCEERHFEVTGFRQTDVGTDKDFTLDISMGPSPAKPAAAPAQATPAQATPAQAAPATPQTAPAATAPAVDATAQ